MFFSLSSCSVLKRKYKREKKTEISKEESKKHKDDIAFYDFYSKKLGIKLTGKENKKLIEEVSDWIGVPHKLGGCDKKGIDCSCFVRNIYMKVYGIDPGRSSVEIFNNFIQVDKNDLKEGDILIFAIDSKKPNHVGIYLSNGNFVHSTTSKGVMVSNINDNYYSKHYHSAVRVKK